jgi:hypothetical protein
MFHLELRVLLDTIRRQGKRGADLEFVGLFLGFRNQMSGIRDQDSLRRFAPGGGESKRLRFV